VSLILHIDKVFINVGRIGYRTMFIHHCGKIGRNDVRPIVDKFLYHQQLKIVPGMSINYGVAPLVFKNNIISDFVLPIEVGSGVLRIGPWHPLDCRTIQTLSADVCNSPSMY
jgi:hypothetical protein